MRPPSFSLSLNALFTLPYRLCNPPPAAGNVRSCKVTPLIKVSLDDVLNKRHLPPLTLKDFEEWLVFVEGCPQYLYFLLWFKEYEARYAAWLAESGCEVPTVPSPCKFASTTTLGSAAASAAASATDLSYSYINLIPPSAALALFFTRAKQTFLDPAPHAPYALGPDALAALIAAHTPSTHSLSPSIPHFTIPPADTEASVLPPALASQPHPHPRELVPLAQYARLALKERLERFVASACHNVGTRRAWCGIAGGAVLALVLGIIPSLVALFWARPRWWRAVGLLGCWLGGTIVVSSFHGICMMIYVFGDLRQLRSFELARPAISPPRAIARARPRLRSLFTRTPDPSDESTKSTSASNNPGATPASPPAILAPQRHVLPIHTPPSPHALSEKANPAWTSTSETSTGTPIVRFQPGAFLFSAASEETTLDVEIGSGSGTGSQGQAQTVIVEEHEDSFGIEISPAYYPEGMDPSAEAGEQRLTSVRSGLGGVRSSVGRVFTWVLRNGRISASGDIGVGSHAGTFGVRSWNGGLGSLPERSGRTAESDLEKGVASDEEDDVEEVEEVDVEPTFTAEFIPHEYPVADAEKLEMGEKPPSPVQFDFDKLPALASPATASRPVSVAEPPRAHMSRTHSPTHPYFRAPTQTPTPAPSPPAPHPAPPQPSLCAHPNARLAPAAASPNPPAPSISAELQDRPWWDTCPRHPAVEATLASNRSSLTQTHAQPHTPASNPVPPSTTRASSRASSGVHSRVRALERPRATSVPAFGPLTRILSPIVSRGQWEIVVRSAAVAALGAWMLIGCLIALPETR